MTDITRFDGPNEWLSNFWPVDVEFEGEIYPSVEHAYQAAKFAKARRRAFRSGSAGLAKALGRGSGKRIDWNSVKEGTMLVLLRKKFRGELAAQLLATEDCEIVEGNTWNDTYWGVCRGVGENRLGKLIMQIRQELRSCEIRA